MNKLIIVLLAVCLVSVHAFVRREAPDSAKPDLFESTKETFAKGWNELTDKVNPDSIKKTFGELVDNINKAVSSIRAPEAPKASN